MSLRLILSTTLIYIILNIFFFNQIASFLKQDEITVEKERLLINYRMNSSSLVKLNSSTTLNENKTKTKSALAQIDEDLSLCNGIDLREITLTDLQKHLNSKILTSVDLVKCYAKRIEGMNPYLNAVLELNPDALAIAKKMDELRDFGKILGPLHGIPILIKDNMGTDDKMETTCGTLALIGIKPKEDAEVVKMLRRGGAIILGKTNLSELAFFRGKDIPNGWSSRGNQTHNAYVLSKDPDGSSSGSAVAVAANLIPVALGTETDGSIIDPASRASVIGLKVTLGRVSTTGVIPLSISQDVVGPITRTVTDAAIVFHAISKFGFKDNCFTIKSGLENCISKDLRVGVIREPFWNRKGIEEEMSSFENVLKILKESKIQIQDPVIASNGTYEIITKESEKIVLLHEFKHYFNEYLQKHVKLNLNKSIQSIEDVIKFNKNNTDEKHDQDLLIEANGTDGIFNRTYQAERDKNLMAAALYTNYIFQKYSLDAVIIPSKNSTLIPSVGGLPHITIPVGYKNDSEPYGISLFGPKNSEEILLQLGFVIENRLNARKPSQFLP